MRDEIREPQQWRSSTPSKTGTRKKMGSTNFGVLRRESTASGLGSIAALPVEAVDAVFADELVSVEPVRGSRRDLVSQGQAVVASSMQSPEGSDLLQSLSAQLAMLKTQQEHLQELLVQAQDVR